MPTISINGQDINYVYNKILDDGVSLVFVHGAGGRIQTWPFQWQETRYARSAQRKRWVMDFPIYMLDLPGHGSSELPGRNSIEAYADDIMAFTEKMEIEKAVIVGHSMGGAIAQEIALRKPENMAGIILIGTGAKMPVTDLILDGLLTDFPKTVRLITKFAWYREAAANFTAVAIQHMLDTLPEVVHGDFYACNQFDYRNQLAEMALPTLVIGAEDDKMMPLKNSQFLADNIPNAELVVIKDAGHYMMVEKTSKVSKAIVIFLNGLEPKE